MALGGLQRFIVDHLGDPGAVLVIDETAELKKGRMTVGVARQHAGITGQIENCQTVVNCAYVTGRGHALFDFRLYLPKAWCADRGRRERARVPDDVPFTTKPALGTAMIAGAAGTAVPFAWVAGAAVVVQDQVLRGKRAHDTDRRGLLPGGAAGAGRLAGGLALAVVLLAGPDLHHAFEHLERVSGILVLLHILLGPRNRRRRGSYQIRACWNSR